MSKKLNIAERFELAVPTGRHELELPADEKAALIVAASDDGFPEPIAKSRVSPCAAGHSNRERGILNHPTHHKANLTALRALYCNTNPTGV